MRTSFRPNSCRRRIATSMVVADRPGPPKEKRGSLGGYSSGSGEGMGPCREDHHENFCIGGGRSSLLGFEGCASNQATAPGFVCPTVWKQIPVSEGQSSEELAVTVRKIRSDGKVLLRTEGVSPMVSTGDHFSNRLFGTFLLRVAEVDVNRRVVAFEAAGRECVSGQ